MKSEKVRYSDLRNHAPYYEADPLTTSAPPNWVGTEDTPPSDDAEVFTVYESWARFNPWVKPPPPPDRNADQYIAARQFFGSADEWLR